MSPTFDAALRDVGADGPRFRIAAANRLADPPEGREDEAAEGLRTLIGDRVGPVREAALEAAGELGAAELLPSLWLAFEDEDRAARQAAVLAAGRVAPEQSAPRLDALLDDPRPEMRFSAVWTLAKVGQANPTRVSERLHDDDPEVRWIAIECLAELGSNEYADAIAERLEDPVPNVRFAAALGLAALQDGRGATLLREALTDDDRAFDAAVALGDLRDPSALGALSKIADRRFGSPIRRAAAARALVLIGERRGVDIIRKILRSWRIEARQYAVELVGELGLEELLPDLERALRRSRAVDRPVYQAALERLADSNRQARNLLASIRDADHAD